MSNKIMDTQQRIDIAPINPLEYNRLRMESSLINIKLARCIDNKYVGQLPVILEELKEFLNKLTDKHKSLFRRPIDLLHSILITRMFYNKKFSSPLYKHDLHAMALHANTEVEFRNLLSLYINAIEESLIQEA